MLITRFFDMRPNATTSPSGRENSSVITKICVLIQHTACRAAAIICPIVILPIRSYLLSFMVSRSISSDRAFVKFLFKQDKLRELSTGSRNLSPAFILYDIDICVKYHLFMRTTSQSPRLRGTLATVAITRGNSQSVFLLVSDRCNVLTEPLIRDLCKCSVCCHLL